jgi:pyruvate,water dikinase
VITTGQSVGQRIASGRVKIIRDIRHMPALADGDIIVTEMTDPDWVPVMKRAAALITTRGGRTCHAAIVSRELKIPAIVGVHDALELLRNGSTITVDCSRGSTGYIYEGTVPFHTEDVHIPQVKLPIELLVNCADPDRAFVLSQLPTDGVGLARTEFIITNNIGVHPMACVDPERITDHALKKQIITKKGPYETVADFYTQTLAQGIAMIAAGFYPRKVVVRLSDFKTNEYRNLLGGIFFEPHEENPMIGFRGALRYYDPHFKDAFALECAALHIVRTQMGLTNVAVMVPFVRTTQEAHRVTHALDSHGLKRGRDGLELYMMCEIPSNVLLLEAFAEYFDAFSIGSNDLTQLTLGVDRDSERLSKAFDERDPAVKKMVSLAIAYARAAGKPIGICGQAPSDYPDFADFVIECGIDSISLNDDAVVPFLLRYA